MRNWLRGGVLVLALVLAGCTGAELEIIFGGAATATAGGIAYWLANQNWAAKICYWVGDEAALHIMPAASRQVDYDVIGACSTGVAFLNTANGMTAAQVNAQLAAEIASLPPDQQIAIQEAAVILDDYLPPSTANVALTSTEINDIIAYLKGWSDGTQTCLNNLPPAIQAARDQAVGKLASLRAKHPPRMKTANYKGGWFKPAK